MAPGVRVQRESKRERERERETPGVRVQRRVRAANVGNFSGPGMLSSLAEIAAGYAIPQAETGSQAQGEGPVSAV